MERYLSGEDQVNILLVDDQPAGLLAMTAAIEGLGQNLVTASSGRDALRKLLEREYAVILLDVQMPGMDGYETASLIRERPTSRETPIIFVTAIHRDEEQVAHGYAVGAVDYIFKPVNAEFLRSKVMVFVEMARKTALIRRQAEALKQREREARELAETRAELLADLERKNLELAAARELAERESRFKSSFLASMSHELRTPLNAIIGFSEILKDGMLGALTDKQNETVGDIFASGEHLLMLINDILDLTKVEAGKMEIEPAAVDVEMLLTASLTVIREKAMAHRIRLALEAAPGLGTMQLDARRMKQILYNLLSNAVKFTPDGGAVTLRALRVDAEAARARRPRGAVGDGDYLEIEVSDTGIGIAPADQARLFQPFVQLDSSLARRYQGTGLGLAMVERLAQLHGGAVGLESEPNKGSTFRVWLPYRTDTVAPTVESPPSPAVAPPGRAPLALIIEDDPAAAEIERIQLARDGIESMHVPDAEQASMLLRATRPDLIVLDILLPGMDGWTFLARLRGDPLLARIPVVIVSIAADAKRGLALGARAVLQKPIARQELVAAVAALGLTPARAGKPLRVLVTDDDPKAVEIVARYLENAHYEVARAGGGREAIESARRDPPDLLILDLMMPEVSGFDVVRSLKDDPRTRAIPIVILTAKVLTPQDIAALNGHVQQVLEKSEFNPEAFLGEVRRALRAPTPAP